MYFKYSDNKIIGFKFKRPNNESLREILFNYKKSKNKVDGDLVYYWLTVLVTYRFYKYKHYTPKNKQKENVIEHLTLEIKRKFEKILGFELVIGYNGNHNLTVIPKKDSIKVYEVLTVQPRNLNARPDLLRHLELFRAPRGPEFAWIEPRREPRPFEYMVKYAYIHKASASKVFVKEYKGKYWMNSSCFEIVNENYQKETVPLFFKGKGKHCPCCGLEFVEKVNFKYDESKEDRICDICITSIQKYKPPQFTEDNIYSENHGGNRRGFIFQVKKAGYEQEVPFGMELEVEFIKNRNESLMKIWKAANKENLYFERDGSLNGNGVEIISNPMTSKYARRFWRPIYGILQDTTAGIKSGVMSGNWNKDTRVSTQFWGIHLTCSRKHWEVTDLAKLNNFFFNPNNAEFLQHIGQRRTMYGDNPEFGRLIKKNKLQLAYRKGMKKEDIAGARHAPVNLHKPKFIEFRFFQTTVTEIEMMKNYDFLQAFYTWIKTENIQYTNLHHQAFLEWLCNPNYPDRTLRYKYLIMYLQQENHNLTRPHQTDRYLEIAKNPFLQHAKKLVIPKLKCA